MNQMRTQRLEDLEQYILESKMVTLDELCEKFEISKNTLRRDIQNLVDKGSIEKVYGGVVAVEKDSAPLDLLPYETRHTTMAEEKDRLCARAACHIEDGDFVYIDTGTSCLNIVDYLTDRKCTILTNSLQVCLKAVPYPNLEVISMPGRLKRETLSYVGADIQEYLKNYNIRKAFMACSGVSVENGLTNASVEEYLVKKAVIQRSASVFLLADHTKFGHFAQMTFCPLKDVDRIITDRPLSREYTEFCREYQVSVELAPEK